MSSKRKNILFILTDDQGPWAMHCAGNDDIYTPNLDRLAAAGVRYENFYCVSPVCSPARASLLTGKIPSAHGVHDWLAKGQIHSDCLSQELKDAFAMEETPFDFRWPKTQLMNDTPIHYLAPHKTFTEVLADNGYECGLSGKWHVGGADVPQAGFTFWKTLAMGGAEYYHQVALEEGEMRMKHGVYVTDYINDGAMEFLDQRDSDKPFCLCVHYTAPHSPWGEGCHPEEYMSLYRGNPFRSIPEEPPHPWVHGVDQSFAEWKSKPHPGVRFVKAQYAPIREVWHEYRQESLTGYFAAVTAMDAAVGKLLDRLEADGLAQDTLVVFTSDNGSNMGHHGIFGKGNGTYPVNMYETSVKVPGLFACPGTIPAGRVLSSMRSHYDVYETLLDFVGIPFEKTEDMPGVSFAAELRGEETDAPAGVVAFDEYGQTRMICERTDVHQLKLVWRGEDGPNELYDLATDPDERVNQFENPAYAEKIAALRDRLLGWFDAYVNPDLDGTKEDVRGKGQIDSHTFIH